MYTLIAKIKFNSYTNKVFIATVAILLAITSNFMFSERIELMVMVGYF